MNNLEYKTLDNLIENELKMQTQRFEQKQQEIINNSLKEKDKEIERLNNIIDELEKYFAKPNKFIERPERMKILDKLKELKEGK